MPLYWLEKKGWSIVGQDMSGSRSSRIQITPKTAPTPQAFFGCHRKGSTRTRVPFVPPLVLWRGSFLVSTNFSPQAPEVCVSSHGRVLRMRFRQFFSPCFEGTPVEITFFWGEPQGFLKDPAPSASQICETRTCRSIGLDHGNGSRSQAGPLLFFVWFPFQ